MCSRYSESMDYSGELCGLKITGEFAVLDCTVRYIFIFLNCDLISSVVLRESDELLGAT